MPERWARYSADGRDVVVLWSDGVNAHPDDIARGDTLRNLQYGNLFLSKTVLT